VVGVREICARACGRCTYDIIRERDRWLWERRSTAFHPPVRSPDMGIVGEMWNCKIEDIPMNAQLMVKPSSLMQGIKLR